MLGIMSLVFVVCAALLPAQESEPGRGVKVTLRARICDADGRPLKDGCLVIGRHEQVTTAGALAKPDARSDDDGNIEFVTTVTPSRWLRYNVMLLTAPGKVAVRYRNPFIGRSRKPLPDPVIDLGEIRLPDGHTIIGRVRQKNGEPIVGARVRAVDGLTTYPWLVASYGSQAQTDARGVFRMSGVFGTAMAIDVSADGFYSKNFASVELGTPLDIRLSASGFVDGVVVDAVGKPVDGTVMVSEEFVGTMRATARVKNGRFRVGVANPCRFKITAYGDDGSAGVASELLDGPATGITLRLDGQRKGQFAVRAVDAASGKQLVAVRAAAIWLSVSLDEATKSLLAGRAKPSNAEGVVALRPPAGGDREGLVYVAVDGYAPIYAEKVKGKAGGEFVAKMVATANVAGVVIDAATGKPAAGMRVTCTPLKGRRERMPRRFSVAPVVTGADGEFSFPALSDGRYDVVARRATGSVSATKRIESGGGKNVERIELTVPMGATVSGTIVGAPAGAKLVLAEDNASAADSPLTSGASVMAACNFEGAISIVAGTFRFPHCAVGARNVLLLVPQPPRQGGALLIELDHLHIGETDQELNLDCAPHLPGNVSGAVTLKGADVPGGRLVVVATQVMNEGGRWIASDLQLARRRWCVLGTDGRYSIPVGRGRYTIEVIDSATGIGLLEPSEPFLVAANRTIKRDLEVSVVEVHASFSVADGRLPAKRVKVLCDGGPDLMGPMTLFGGGSHGSRGFDIPGVDEVVAFYVRPCRVRLDVEPGATSIVGGRIRFGGKPLASPEFDATLGKVHDIVVPLKPAREYPIK